MSPLTSDRPFSAYFSVKIGLFTVFWGLTATVFYSGQTSAVPNTSSGAPTQGSSAGDLAMQHLVEGMVMPNFQPSLEMKEQADFLLTPAFLMQAAISRDIVLTYPAD